MNPSKVKSQVNAPEIGVSGQLEYVHTCGEFAEEQSPAAVVENLVRKAVQDNGGEVKVVSIIEVEGSERNSGRWSEILRGRVQLAFQPVPQDANVLVDGTYFFTVECLGTDSFDYHTVTVELERQPD